MTDINDIGRIGLSVKAVRNVMDMHKEAGREKVSVSELLQMCAERIDRWQEKYEHLEALCKTHDFCNLSEFANWMGVSRQTVYNWRDSGYLIQGEKGIDMKGTCKFWGELKRILRW